MHTEMDGHHGDHDDHSTTVRKKNKKSTEGNETLENTDGWTNEQSDRTIAIERSDRAEPLADHLHASSTVEPLLSDTFVALALSD